MQELRSRIKDWEISIATALDLLSLYEDSMKASMGLEAANMELVKVLVKDLITSEAGRLICRAADGGGESRTSASAALNRIQSLCGALTISLAMKGKESAEDWVVQPSEDFVKDIEAYASCLENTVTDPLPSLFGDTAYIGMSIQF